MKRLQIYGTSILKLYKGGFTLDEEVTKKRVKEQFAKNAQKYVDSESHAKGMDLSLMIQWLQPESNWDVLDVATGGGHVAKTLAPYVHHVYATDLTKEMLANSARFLKQERNIQFVLADAEALPFLDEAFDLVTCRIAAHHFPHPHNFIKEVARVLKPGGRFLFIDNVSPEDGELADFYNAFERLRDVSHVRCLSIKEWKQLIAGHSLIGMKENLRKKKMNFSQWIDRTVISKEQKDNVQQFMFTAKEELKSYFEITQDSFAIDEWMALFEKQ
jgi:ubiquinone/menaquinone biosynthesis C-methylase UbiE